MMRPHVRCLLLAALFALLAGGCGQSPEDRPAEGTVQAPDRAAARDASANDTSRGLAYLSYAADVTGDRPLLCLSFSSPLDPSVDYSAYVGIDAQVALVVSGQRLCIGGLGFGETHAITLRAGLPAADGTRLAADINETLSFADRPAVVRFAGGGVILPRIDADGVGIETVNVAALRVTVSRVNDRALAFRAISAGYDAASGEYAWMPWNAQPGEVARELWQGEMDTPGPTNAAVTTVFPLLEVLGELAPGAYVLRAENLAELELGGERPIARAERWLIVTDLAFTAYRGSDGLDVVLRSLQSAASARDVRVQLVARSNEILAEATSDREGRVRFASAMMRGEGPNAPRMLMAYGADGDFAVLDLDRAPVDLSDHPISGRDRGAVDAYLYLDRDLYRPGERVYASALIRNATGDALRDRASTLVLTAPSGLEHERVRFDAAQRAGAVFHEFVLPRSAARGQWRLTLSVDGVGELASRRIGVEDFVPQRVELRLSADTDTAMADGETRSVEALARFLYGAPGAGLEVEGSVRVQPDPTPFAAHDGVSFGVHDEEFREGLFDIPRTITDGSGTAVLALAPEAREPASTLPLRLRTTVSALEPGGRAVNGQIDVPYRPRAFYVGLQDRFADGRGEIDSPVHYRVIAVDANGTGVAAELDWRLLRNDWTYDWYRSDGGEWRWRRTRRVVPIEEGRVAIAADGATQIQTRALDWGDYTLIVADGRESLASSGFWVGWGARPEEGIEAPDRVRVSAPASPPRVGERAEISILAPYAGVAEIVVATDRVLETRRIDVPENGARISLPVTRDWGVGAYVMVSVLTPRDAQRQPRPRRAVGVAHIPVDVAADGRLFTLALDAPERMRPAQRLDIAVEASGLPARERAWVTLAAVDEGILQLTGFQSPDPADWFFGKARLGVDLLDDYGRLLDPNQGRAAAVRSGGDTVGGEGLSVVPIRTVALFTGPLQLDAQGRGTLSVDVPDFNGELRLMAVAWSDAALASVSQPLTVRDAVPAELVLPRFLAPGDQAQATLTLDNVEGTAGRYRSMVSATGAVTVEPERIDMTLRAGQRSERAVGISAGAEGLADIALSVEGPGGFAASRDWPLQVRSAWLPERRVTRQRLQPGARLAPPQDALDGLQPERATLQLSFAASPIDVAAIYRALADYPYGCSEQLISRALPLLYAEQLAALNEITPPVEADRMVRDAIETLLSRQSADGAFGLWRIGDAGASPWLGAYFTDFLARAAEAGHPVPAAALERALQALQPVAQGELWRAYGYDSQVPEARFTTDTRERLAHRSAAYASYVLARAGRVDRSRLRYLHDEQLARIESPLARAHIAAALASIGDRARAHSAFTAAIDALGYENSGDWFQSARRDIAGVLALVAEAEFDEFVEALAARAAEDLPEATALTTQEQAFLLLAARALAGPASALAIEDDAGNDPGTLVNLTAAQLANPPVFHNRGARPVWVTLFARGSSQSPPSPASEGLTIDKQLFDRAGGAIDASALVRGDQLVIALTISAQAAALAPLVVADLLPAGFEIEAVLTPTDAGARGRFGWLGELAAPRITEARDDRFVAALDVRGGQRYRLAYLVRAVTPGTFALPAAQVEHMYRPEAFARSAPGELVIAP